MAGLKVTGRNAVIDWQCPPTQCDTMICNSQGFQHLTKLMKQISAEYDRTISVTPPKAHFFLQEQKTTELYLQYLTQINSTSFT